VRLEMARTMRESIVERCSYTSITRRLLRFMSDGLAREGDAGARDQIAHGQDHKVLPVKGSSPREPDRYAEEGWRHGSRDDVGEAINTLVLEDGCVCAYWLIRHRQVQGKGGAERLARHTRTS